MKIGFAGFSDDSRFDTKAARSLVKDIFNFLCDRYGNNFEVVSGLTNLGIPGIVYAESFYRDLKSIGISAEEALEYDCFPVDDQIIIGEKFGDESDYFIDYIDILITIGGGTQTKSEIQLAKDKGVEVMSYEPTDKFEA